MSDGAASSKCRQLLMQAKAIESKADSAQKNEGDQQTAIRHLCEAVEVLMNAYGVANQSQRKPIKQLIDLNLKQAESLKAILNSQSPSVLQPSKTQNILVPPRVVESSSVQTPAATMVAPLYRPRSPLPPMSLSDDELEVLRHTSKINDMIFLPWSDSDAYEPFTFAHPFSDPDGTLPLSEKQVAKWGFWRRPKQFMSHPQVIKKVSCLDIIQDVVTDCSFVASLCIAAAYENRFDKKNQARHPMYNPSGKYVVRLLYNGILRRFPVSREGKLMCTYTLNQTELWPSLIEKAYMKLMGGYDFPGSNSSIDLYTLTGWIPEQILMHDERFKEDTQWDRMYEGLRYGDTLVTVATGDMTPDEAERYGLVSSHAYAVLNVDVVNGVRLLQLKNPWSIRGWKGPYSHLDQQAWTPSLCQRLNYDPQKSAYRDDGIFWIDYESLCKRFSSIHLNWNPELFTYRCTHHARWPLDAGPANAFYNLAGNPQYRLRVVHQPPPSVNGGPAAGTAPVWLLLTKHITRKEENKDYISLFVYDKTSGERIYSPDQPFVSSDFINSPHVLVRFNVPPGGVSLFTVVALQFEKTRDFYYTLRVLSMAPVELEPVEPVAHQRTIDDEWTTDTAGGSLEHPSFISNHQYRLVVKERERGRPGSGIAAFNHHSNGSSVSNGVLTLNTAAPKSIHLTLARGGVRVTNFNFRNTVSNSGAYCESTCFCPLENLSPGEYTVVPSTLQPGQTGPFSLTVDLDGPFDITRLPAEGAGLYKRTVRGNWGSRPLSQPPTSIGTLSTTSTPNHSTYYYYFTLARPTQLTVRLQALDTHPVPALRISLHRRLRIPELQTRSPGVGGDGGAHGGCGAELANSGAFLNSVQGVLLPMTRLTEAPGEYVLTLAAWDPHMTGRFQAFIYSDQNIQNITDKNS
ncbi:cysteine protease [Dimargaris cristalligena]|nr:cysteine protease [Dimargaris cristalligena]